MEIIMKNLDEINGADSNPRRHPEDQLLALQSSIRQWGFTIPVVIDEGGVLLAGHGRVEAARRLGMDQVPTVMTIGWTDGQKRAYIVADNRLAETSIWDLPMLHAQLAELESAGFDLSAIDQDLPPIPMVDENINDVIAQIEREQLRREEQRYRDDRAFHTDETEGVTMQITCPSCGHAFTKVY